MPMNHQHRYVKAEAVDVPALIEHLAGMHWLPLDTAAADVWALAALHQLDHARGAAHRRIMFEKARLYPHQAYGLHRLLGVPPHGSSPLTPLPYSLGKARREGL